MQNPQNGHKDENHNLAADHEESGQLAEDDRYILEELEGFPLDTTELRIVTGADDEG
jgi:hypothetical protein